MTSSNPCVSADTSLPASSSSFSTMPTSSSSSSLSSSGSSPSSAVNALLSLPASEQQRFLEQLLRLRPPAAAAAAAAESARLMSDVAAGGSRVTLYRTKNKLQQLEDILLESHLLDNSGFQANAALEPAAVAAIFGRMDDQAAPYSAVEPNQEATMSHHGPIAENGLNNGLTDGSGALGDELGINEVKAADSAASNLSNCVEEIALDEKKECCSNEDVCGINSSALSEDPCELSRLRDCWSDLRRDLSLFYRHVLHAADVSSIAPTMAAKLASMGENVRQLCMRDPQQLFLNIESVVKEFILDTKLRLIELLQNKSDDLAQTFIRETLLCYDRLCLAATLLSPVLSVVESSYLGQFSLSWEAVNKHLYEAIIHSDPLIQNHVPILISQLKALYSEESSDGDSCTSLLRHYLDVDVELEQVRCAWSKAEELFGQYTEQQSLTKSRHQQLMALHLASKLKEQQDCFLEEDDADAIHYPQPLEFEDCKDELTRLLWSTDCTSPESPEFTLWLHFKMLFETSQYCSITDEEDKFIDESDERENEADDRFTNSFMMPMENTTCNESTDEAECSVSDAMYGNLYWDVEALITAANNSMRDYGVTADEILFYDVERDEDGSYQREGVLRKLLGLMKPGEDGGTMTATEMYVMLQQQMRKLKREQDEKKELQKQLAMPTDAKSNGIASPSTSVTATAIPTPEQTVTAAKVEAISTETTDTRTSSKSSSKSSTSSSTTTRAPGSACTGVHIGGKKNSARSKELNKLLQQHFCVHRKGKQGSKNADGNNGNPVPTEDGHPQEDDAHDEDNNDDHQCEEVDNGDSSSTSTTTTMDKSSSLSSSCSCCYCEVFGPASSSSSAVAPVSKKFPEMRERLRHLLKKKKTSNSNNSSQKQIKNKALQQQRAALTKNSLAKEADLTPTQETDSTKVEGLVTIPKTSSASIPSVAPKQTVTSKPNIVSDNKASFSKTKQVVPTVSNVEVSKKQSTAGSTNGGNPVSAGNISLQKTQAVTKQQPSPRRASVDSVLSGQTSCTHSSGRTTNNDDTNNKYDVDAMLRFIEGQNESRNEKKKAKKERQKKERLAEQRRREEEERLRREAEEKERKKREEEERKRREEEERILKKQKKKAAQRAKKEAGKAGSNPQNISNEQDRHEATLGYLEGLREQQMREIEALKQRHMAQIEEEQRKIRQLANNNGTKGNVGAEKTRSKNKGKKANDKTVKSSVAPQQTLTSKNVGGLSGGSSQQIRIARTPDGGVTFTPLPPGHPTSNSFNSSFSPMNTSVPMAPQSNFAMPQAMPCNFGAFNNAPSVAETAFDPQQRQQPPPPQQPQQPMVTIKRLPPGSAGGDSTVTISMKDEVHQSKSSLSNEKLLYTLINGQVHKVNAPNHPDLIPGVSKTIDGESNKKKKKKKKKKEDSNEEAGCNGANEAKSSFDLQSMMQAMPTLNNASNKSNLPFRQDGKIDLSKLELPPGISITKVQGPIPQRKYFPDPTTSTSNATMGIEPHPPPQPTPLPTPSPSSSSTCPGVRKASDVQLPAELQGVPDSNIIVVDTNALANEDTEAKCNDVVNNYGKGDGNTEQNLKSGPQVLIKNVNGKVSITPLPDTAFTPKKKLAKKSKRKNQSGNAIDEDINRVFAPSENLDLENGDIDDDERVIEAFKRFCFNSVPLQQKTKVNFDVKNIAFKKK